MKWDDAFFPVPKPKKERKKQSRNIPTLVRKKVMARDEGRCVRCGSNYQLQLHHLITKGRYDYDLYLLDNVHDMRNLVVVCFHCHRLIHDRGEVMKEMLEYQKKNFGNVFKYDN